MAVAVASSLVASLLGPPGSILGASPALAATVNSGTVACNSPFLMASGLNLGDQVQITATLNDADLNEGSEGEVLNVVVQPGGETWTDSAYGIPQSTLATANASNQALIAMLSSNCDGDESATIVASYAFSPAAFKAGTKQQLNDTSKDTALTGIAAGGFGLLCAFTEGIGCAVGFFVVGSGLGGASVAVGDMAQDPPDPNFTAIYKPRVATVPQVRPGAGMTPAEAAAANLLAQDSARLLAYAIAFEISANRASGAAQAGDSSWETKQRQAEKGYGLALAGLMDAYAGDLNAVVNALNGAGFPSVTVTAAQAQAFQLNVLSNGLPTTMVSDLGQLGLTSGEIQELTVLAFSAPTDSLTGAYPQKLADPSLLNALRTSANDLRADLSKL